MNPVMQHLQMLFFLFKVYRIWAEVTSDIFGRSWKSQYTHYSSCVMLRMPLGAMVSSPDQFRYSSLDTHLQNRRLLLCSFLDPYSF